MSDIKVYFYRDGKRVGKGTCKAEKPPNKWTDKKGRTWELMLFKDGVATYNPYFAHQQPAPFPDPFATRYAQGPMPMQEHYLQQLETARFLIDFSDVILTGLYLAVITPLHTCEKCGRDHGTINFVMWLRNADALRAKGYMQGAKLL